MTTKHTPGPWSLTDKGNVIGADGEQIVNFLALANAGIESPKANACLIASTPDLLAQRDALAEALTMALGWLEACRDAGDETFRAIARAGAEEARAALAKVKP